MELQLVNNHSLVPVSKQEIITSSTEVAFIQANTIPMSLAELEHQHLIPVFVKDNEPVISHQDFINCALEIVHQVFPNETILSPAIRVSHPIKGRIPEAKDKRAKDLLPHEETIYFERMMFVIEVASIRDRINGNELCLTIGGVKAYNLDNLYNRKGADEHFKIFIGFQNKVCCNLCVWSDGLVLNLKAKHLSQLMKGIYELVLGYKMNNHLKAMQSMTEAYLTEHQFATMIGRARLYQFLPAEEKKLVPRLHFGDSQISSIARDYYQDVSFCKRDNGDISLWKVYNLFTGANKQSYIDSFLGRSVNAFELVGSISHAIQQQEYHWFLS
ncbi:DUF3871 family protein [Runella salmonicolor]|jgi:hypothetical protein|uniref:DUF3871 family protein n=1 Tax=Runella salmonicolor TaxID=2950278 RepID=A0ABT1FQN3_9BACT|nr:DUF3871 family protein [Runella salmonicolor]MCP1384070.1 DUF3871 family protein [Runella salmonicolor]